MYLKKILCTSIVFFCVFFSVNIYASEKLLFAVDIIRHGDRTPIYGIPNDHYVWKEGMGELTKTGIKQEIKLGQDLRQRYVTKYHLLPKIYDPRTIYVRSTDVKRTIVSANSFLLGLYPLKDRPIQNQTIPVYTVPKAKDNLLLAKPDASIFSLAKRYVVNRNFWREKTYGLERKLLSWSTSTGLQIMHHQELARLADNLYVRQAHKIPLPKGITQQDANEIIALGEAIIINDFKLKSVANPMGKQLLKTVIAYMQQAIQQQVTLKYILLSGHDSTIMSVMTTLNTPLEKLPNYAAHLSFLLFENDQKYYVTIAYNNKPIKIPGCDETTCTLTQLKAITST